MAAPKGTCSGRPVDLIVSSSTTLQQAAVMPSFGMLELHIRLRCSNISTMLTGVCTVDVAPGLAGPSAHRDLSAAQSRVHQVGATPTAGSREGHKHLAGPARSPVFPWACDLLVTTEDTARLANNRAADCMAGHRLLGEGCLPFYSLLQPAHTAHLGSITPVSV